MNEIVWRAMRSEDIEQVLELERQSFTIPWSEQAFREELTNELAYYLLGWLDGRVIAYAGMWLVIDEANITNVAVAEDLRGQGIGRELLMRMINIAAARRAKSMTLEVRPSNAAALALYSQLGFERAGVRKNYYEDNHEDGLILWLRGERFERQAKLP